MEIIPNWKLRRIEYLKNFCKLENKLKKKEYNKMYNASEITKEERRQYNEKNKEKIKLYKIRNKERINEMRRKLYHRKKLFKKIQNIFDEVSYLHNSFQTKRINEGDQKILF